MNPNKLQPWALADLPLHRLLSLGRKVADKDLPEIRIAILGNAATQHYHQALAAVFKLRGLRPQIYEAEFDMIEHEVRDANSQLFAHRPDFVVLHVAAQALWTLFLNSASKATFANEVFAELQTTWKAIKAHSSATIVQHNLVVPIDRPFGNRTLATSTSFAGAVAQLNSLLTARADEFGVLIADTESLAAYHGKRQWLDERLWCQAKQALSPSFLPTLAKNVSDVILLERGVAIKCVVLDLDNTLWGGVLADDGIERIEIGHTELGLAFYRFQMSLKELRERGVLLAACSKNDQNNVLKVLDEHPDMLLRKSDFSVIVANFGDKVSNIRHIQETLNIAFDSMVFLDDTAFERDLVRSALPSMQVPELPEDPAHFLGSLVNWNLFEGRAATAEDVARTGYYQADAARAEIRGEYEGLDDFIANLAMEAQILPVAGYALPRVHQLVQRSNQFNVMTKRYSEEELRHLAASDKHVAFSVRLSDRLGDNGIIATVIVEKRGRDAVVDTWIMSCRVLGRKVEELTMQQIASAAQQLGCDRIIGQYAPTAKNHMVKGLFSSMGFTDAGSSGDVLLFSLDLADYKPETVPIKIASWAEAESHD